MTVFYTVTYTINGCLQEEDEKKEEKPQKAAGKKEQPKVRALF